MILTLLMLMPMLMIPVAGMVQLYRSRHDTHQALFGPVTTSRPARNTLDIFQHSHDQHEKLRVPRA